jgi:hypothetical protein
MVLEVFFAKKTQPIKRSHFNQRSQRSHLPISDFQYTTVENFMADVKQQCANRLQAAKIAEWAENCADFEIRSGGMQSDNDGLNFSDKNGNLPVRMRNLVAIQLIAASPASLPLHTIVSGVRMEFGSATSGCVATILEELVNCGVAIKICECGFCNRYRLIEDCQSEHWEDWD